MALCSADSPRSRGAAFDPVAASAAQNAKRQILIRNMIVNSAPEHWLRRRRRRGRDGCNSTGALSFLGRLTTARAPGGRPAHGLQKLSLPMNGEIS